MIAVIEEHNKAVWGFGLNKAAAMSDAIKAIASKPKFKVDINRLQYAELRKDAPLHLDGEVLFDYCVIGEAKEDVQLGFFDECPEATGV